MLLWTLDFRRVDLQGLSHEASRAVSYTPVEGMGFSPRTTLRPGMRADRLSLTICMPSRHLSSAPGLRQPEYAALLCLAIFDIAVSLCASWMQLTNVLVAKNLGRYYVPLPFDRLGWLILPLAFWRLGYLSTPSSLSSLCISAPGWWKWAGGAVHTLGKTGGMVIDGRVVPGLAAHA